MAELTAVAAAAGVGLDLNTAGNPTESAMAYLQDEVISAQTFKSFV